MRGWRYSSNILDMGTTLWLSGKFHAPVTLPPKERDSGTHWIESLVGPRTGLDAVENIKIFCACRELDNLDNRLTNGSEFVSLTRLARFAHRTILDCSFLLKAKSTPGP
jgi:hypothetical protein